VRTIPDDFWFVALL